MILKFRTFLFSFMLSISNTIADKDSHKQKKTQNEEKKDKKQCSSKQDIPKHDISKSKYVIKSNVSSQYIINKPNSNLPPLKSKKNSAIITTSDENTHVDLAQKNIATKQTKKGQKIFKSGPYHINNLLFVPQHHFDYLMEGVGSFYSNEVAGNLTAIGDIFDPNEITAAHRTLPLPCFVRVTNLTNGKSLIVLVNDRGPYIKGRIIDLSARCAKILGFYRQGIIKVRVECLPKMSLALGKIIYLTKQNDKRAIELYNKIKKYGVRDIGNTNNAK